MFLFRFFGLTLLDDRIRGNEYLRKFRIINLSWVAINIITFIFLVASPSTKIFSRNFIKMSQIIEIANYLFALATNLIIHVHVQMVLEKDIQSLGKLRQLDQLLRDKFGETINHDKIGRSSMRKALITFVGAAVCSALNAYNAMRDGSFQLLFVHNYFLKTIINLRYIQNFIRIDFIKQHILGIHNAILKVGERNTVEWKIVLVLDSFNRRHGDSLGKIDDAKDVLLLKSCYATIFESMKLLENCFGWSLLAMISFTFIDLTSNLYWFCIAILNLDDKIHVVDCIFEIIPSVVIICCLIYSSYDASRKAREVINSVSRLCTNTTSDYNKCVKEFLMQIYHERVENSANDFFVVDFQLFSAVSCLNDESEIGINEPIFSLQNMQTAWRIL